MDSTQMSENKTLIDKLYSLRAGLSLVAVKKETMDNEKKNKSKIEETYFEKRKILNEKKDYCLSRRSEIKEKMVNSNKDIQYDIDYYENELKFGARLKRVFELQKKVLAADDEVRVFLLYFIGIWLAIITFPVFAIIGALATSRKMKKELKVLLKKVETEEQIDEKWKNDEQYIELTKKIEELDIELSKCDSEEKEFNEDKNRRLEEKRTIIKDAYDYSVSLHNALISEYSSTLDRRDWNNIDLIIYNMETGRADTLKEALQQVDNYRNTEKIVGAIKMATQAICSTISIEHDRIERLVSNCTDAVNSRLNSMEKNINQLIKSEEMRQAMLKKSSLTSDELVKEVKQLREEII